MRDIAYRTMPAIPVENTGLFFFLDVFADPPSARGARRTVPMRCGFLDTPGHSAVRQNFDRDAALRLDRDMKLA